MCYETTARPPMPPIAGGAATGESHHAEGVGRQRVRGVPRDGPKAAARPAIVDPAGRPRSARVLRGPRAALRGSRASTPTAFDYFGRTAGVGRRDDDFDFWPEVMKTTAGDRRDRRRRGRRAASRRTGADEDLHGRLLLRRTQLVQPGGARARPVRRDRVLRQRRRRGTRRTLDAPIDQVGDVRVPGARPVRRRRPDDHRRRASRRSGRRSTKPASRTR